MAWLAAAGCLLAGACGGPQRGADSAAGAPHEPTSAPAGPAASDPQTSRTQIERRRDAACEQLAPRITACAVEDARADFAAGKIDRAQLERDTAPAIQQKHTEEFDKACKGEAYSSRQVRVLEVCPREETRCAPLLDCLGHLSDAPRKAPAAH